MTNSGNVYSIAFAIDQTVISDASLVAVTEYSLESTLYLVENGDVSLDGTFVAIT